MPAIRDLHSIFPCTIIQEGDPVLGGGHPGLGRSSGPRSSTPYPTDLCSSAPVLTL